MKGPYKVTVQTTTELHFYGNPRDARAKYDELTKIRTGDAGTVTLCYRNRPVRQFHTDKEWDSESREMISRADMFFPATTIDEDESFADECIALAEEIEAGEWDSGRVSRLFRNTAAYLRGGDQDEGT